VKDAKICEQSRCAEAMLAEIDGIALGLDQPEWHATRYPARAHGRAGGSGIAARVNLPV
jgi:hypothetical protein